MTVMAQAEVARPLTAASLQSPRKPGVLNTSYETRFGTSDVLHPTPDKANGGPPATPRGLRPGLTKFSDPTNPFDRILSKGLVNGHGIKAEPDRAGARTRNPGMIPTTTERACSVDTIGTVPYRYSTGHDYRPSKKPGAGKPTPRFAAVFAADQTDSAPGNHGTLGRALANYLNDMKQSGTSRRVHKDWGPSPLLQRMNDRKVKLCAERVDESRDRAPPERRNEAAAVPNTPRGANESQLFARKRRVTVPNAPGHVDTDETPTSARSKASSCFTRRNCSPGSQISILSHEELPIAEHQQRVRESSVRRQAQAKARFEEINQHMLSAREEMRQNFEAFKARGNGGSGQITHHCYGPNDEVSSIGRFSRSTSVDSAHLRRTIV